MGSYQLSLGLALVALLVYFVLDSIWTAYCDRQRAKQWGCKPAFIRPHKWPLGLDILKRYNDVADTNEAQNDDLVVFKEMGERATWFQQLAGMWHHVTSDPKNIQALLALQFNDFELGPVRHGAFEPFLGRGIFTSDGEAWQHDRAMLRPQFTRTQVSDLDLEERHLQDLFQRLPVSAESGWTDKIDLGPLLFNLTLDSATEFLLGESVQSQLRNSEWSKFGDQFDIANLESLFRFRLMNFYWLYNSKKLRDNSKAVHRTVDYFVKKALAGEKPKGKENSYIFSYELAKFIKDPIYLRGQIVHILLAGRDTTASTLGFVLYHLARYPSIFDKLRKTIIDTFGTGTEKISFETLKGCYYLQYVLAETQRLEPVVPENGRRARRNTTLPRGGGSDGQSPIYIRKGEEVMYNTRMMHRSKDLWGEDADEYKPERWRGLKYGWEYLPFSGGPRVCIGQQFALTEVSYVLVRMLQRFDQIEPMDENPLKHKFSATAAPLEVLVRLHEATEQRN